LKTRRLPGTRERARARRLCLPAFLLLASCEQLKSIAEPLGTFAGSLITAAANNYAPGHGQAVKSLIGALLNTNAGAATATPEPAAAAPRLELDVALLKQTLVAGRQVLEPFGDGAVLRDGRDAPEAGDRFRIAFRAGQQCFVYILGVDATGWVTPIFPSRHSSHSNPVEMGREHQLPDPAYAYSLNTHRGIEHIYFIASEEERPDIESLLAAFEGETQPPPAGDDRVGEAAVVSRGFDREGLGLDMLVQTALGSQKVTPAAFLSSEAGNDLVITRWFHHE
jgi:hypothetical protein